MKADLRRALPIAGVLLADAVDPIAAASAVQAFLAGEATPLDLDEAGVPVARLTTLAPLLPTARADREEILTLGAAWALGARSTTTRTSHWTPVLSGVTVDPTRQRKTAETLITLIMGARRQVRLFAPYVDRRGIAPISRPLAQATSRGARVHFAFVARFERDDSLGLLREQFSNEGDQRLASLVPLEASDRFPHLKMLTADDERAYVGSANLTWGGLVSNIELGALVEGSGVLLLNEVFDMLLTDPHA